MIYTLLPRLMWHQFSYRQHQNPADVGGSLNPLGLTGVPRDVQICHTNGLL